MGSRSFVGGFRLGRWRWHATWPFVRLTVGASGVRLGPSARWLSVLIATYDVPWHQIRSAELVRGGLRFRFTGRVNPCARYGPLAWLYLRQSRIDFWYRPKDEDQVLAAVRSKLGDCRATSPRT